MNKRLAAKEAELRQLRLAQIRTVTRLKKAEQLHRPPVVDTSSVRREELDLENKVYSDSVQCTVNSTVYRCTATGSRSARTGWRGGGGAGECLVIILIFTSLRHAIAGDVVMLSHLAMKLFYVKMDTEQMEGEADL